MDKSRPLAVHCSNAEAGGAERSLLQELVGWKKGGMDILVLVPGRGGFTKMLGAQGIPFETVPLPAWVNLLTQHQMYWQWAGVLVFSPVLLVSLLLYLVRLRGKLAPFDQIYSSGIKSHCALVLLAPALRGCVVLNIRDFIEPLPFRRVIAFLAARFGMEVVANSQVVARDYRNASVVYPDVRMPAPVVDRRRKDGRIVISHVSFFAPYKGQDLFVDYARKILDAGIDAEFRIIGDVIYPGARYRRFRELVYRKVKDLGLEERVKFLGKIDDIQPLLEESHVLLHCTRDPEPFGRVVMEGVLCGCEVVCHGGSGVCEVVEALSINAMEIMTDMQFDNRFVLIHPLENQKGC